MLGLLRQNPKLSQATNIINNMSYADSVKGYHPNIDQHNSDIYKEMEIETHTSDIHVCHGNPRHIQTTDTQEDCRDFLGLSDTDDSGCHCSQGNCGDSGSHNSTFSEESFHNSFSESKTKEDTTEDCTQRSSSTHLHCNHSETSIHHCSDDEDVEEECSDEEESSSDEEENSSEMVVIDQEEGSASSEDEGGWISEEDLTSDKKNDSDDEEAYDLFADNRLENYGEGESSSSEEDEAVIIKNMSTNRIQNDSSKVRKPALPPRSYGKTYSYPPKKASQYKRQMGVHVSHHSKQENNVKRNKSNTSFNLYSEADEDIYNMLVCSMGAPRANHNGYAFPRVLPDEISDVCEFWETDFQVDSSIIPSMSTWEKIGIAPKRTENLKDYQQYMTYKTLYHKWVQCNESKDQWYEKYGFSSLKHVLYVKPVSFKLYPDQCQPISGLQEKMDLFEIFYECLTADMDIHVSPTTDNTEAKCSDFTFRQPISMTLQDRG